ncbi:hypothetical protein TWF696_004303 [Orbilia brochopaga]|uniref:Uncharacterized protein n=1 Tax=Orbilia brochopaga TaxID=3140254 RepID=A0AAV9V6H6_9PEZI
MYSRPVQRESYAWPYAEDPAHQNANPTWQQAYDGTFAENPSRPMSPVYQQYPNVQQEPQYHPLYQNVNAPIELRQLRQTGRPVYMTPQYDGESFEGPAAPQPVYTRRRIYRQPTPQPAIRQPVQRPLRRVIQQQPVQRIVQQPVQQQQMQLARTQPHYYETFEEMVAARGDQYKPYTGYDGAARQVVFSNESYKGMMRPGDSAFRAICGCCTGFWRSDQW